MAETNRLPDWLLERLAQNELPAPLERSVQKRLLAEPGGPARLAALQAEDAAFLSRPEVGARLGAVRASAAQRVRSSPRPYPLLLAAAATLAVAIVAVRPGLHPATADTRVKGLSPTLVIYRHAGSAVERLSEGSTVKPGDEVQLGYTASGRQYGAILSVDGRGVVTLHFPEKADALPTDLRLSQPSAGAIGPVALPHALALDDAPGFERFFFVTSSQPIELAAILSAARDLAGAPGAAQDRLPLPPSIDQTSILLRKPQP